MRPAPEGMVVAITREVRIPGPSGTGRVTYQPGAKFAVRVIDEMLDLVMLDVTSNPERPHCFWIEARHVTPNPIELLRELDRERLREIVASRGDLP